MKNFILIIMILGFESLNAQQYQLGVRGTYGTHGLEMNLQGELDRVLTDSPRQRGYSYTEGFIGGQSWAVGFTLAKAIHPRLNFFSGLHLHNLDYPYEIDVRLDPSESGQNTNMPLPVRSIGNIYHNLLELELGTRYFFGKRRVRFFLAPNLNGHIFLTSRRSGEIILENGLQMKSATTDHSATEPRRFSFSAGLDLGIEARISEHFAIKFQAGSGWMPIPFDSSRDGGPENPCNCMAMEFTYWMK